MVFAGSGFIRCHITLAALMRAAGQGTWLRQVLTYSTFGTCMAARAGLLTPLLVMAACFLWAPCAPSFHATHLTQAAPAASARAPPHGVWQGSDLISTLAHGRSYHTILPAAQTGPLQVAPHLHSLPSLHMRRTGQGRAHVGSTAAFSPVIKRRPAAPLRTRVRAPACRACKPSGGRRAHPAPARPEPEPPRAQPPAPHGWCAVAAARWRRVPL
jgi:hypothetical protein